MAKTEAGQDEEEAAASVLGELTFSEVGREVARFWNFSESIIATMTTTPRLPRNSLDADGYLKQVVFFSNRFTSLVCNDQDFQPLFYSCRRIFGLSPGEGLGVLAESIDYAADVSQIFRYGLSKMKLRSKLVFLRRQTGRPDRSAATDSA